MTSIHNSMTFASIEIILLNLGVLGKWKALTNVLADTLKELRSGRAEVYTPRLLLSRLTHKLPQFAGGDQHDSHELLRHLLDATREEDIKRYQAFILEKKGELY